MSKTENLPATFETIFTQDYWGEIKSPKDAGLQTASKIHRDMMQQMQELTAMAANSIYHGNLTQHLPEGAEIDRDPNNSYTQPGTVLLTDIEVLTPLSKGFAQYNTVYDADRAHYLQRFIHDEEELEAQPAGLFKNYGTIKEIKGKPHPVVFPYRKFVRNFENNALYCRLIGLVASGIDKSAKTTNRMIDSWKPVYESGVAGEDLYPRKSSFAITSVEVGESIADSIEASILRVKSAEICYSGTLEYAKQTKRARRGLFAGRLATSASFAQG